MSVDKKDKLVSLISIMAEYDKNYHYFTYNGKIIDEPITITDDKELNKIYFINKTLHQFIQDLNANKTNFRQYSFQQSCVNYNTPRLIINKCKSQSIYSNNIIELTLINNAITSNFKISKFVSISNTNILIVIDESNISSNISSNSMKQLKLIATELQSRVSSKNTDEIIERFNESYIYE